MRLWDYLSLASHGLRRGYETAFVLFVAAAAALACFAGAIFLDVHTEKAAPCELAVSAPGWLALTEQSVQDFRTIDHVVDAAGVIDVPVTAACGKYTANLTLEGIDGSYLSDLVYILGEPFPSAGAMPWLALSQGAAKSFSDPEDKAQHGASYMPDIDWLEAGFSLSMGDGAVAAKVSGLFEGDEPAAYIGLDIARSLLQNQGKPAGFSGARVRVANIGAAEAVSQSIAALGYNVENRDSARQEAWDARTREAVYLAVLAGAGLLCAWMARRTGAALGREEARRREDVLRWAGVGEAAIRGIAMLRTAYLALLGAAIGAAAYWLISSLSQI